MGDSAAPAQASRDHRRHPRPRVRFWKRGDSRPQDCRVLRAHLDTGGQGPGPQHPGSPRERVRTARRVTRSQTRVQQAGEALGLWSGGSLTRDALVSIPTPNTGPEVPTGRATPSAQGGAQRGARERSAVCGTPGQAGRTPAPPIRSWVPSPALLRTPAAGVAWALWPSTERPGWRCRPSTAGLGRPGRELGLTSAPSTVSSMAQLWTPVPTLLPALLRGGGHGAAHCDPLGLWLFASVKGEETQEVLGVKCMGGAITDGFLEEVALEPGPVKAQAARSGE